MESVWYAMKSRRAKQNGWIAMRSIGDTWHSGGNHGQQARHTARVSRKYSGVTWRMDSEPGLTVPDTYDLSSPFSHAAMRVRLVER